MFSVRSTTTAILATVLCASAALASGGSGVVFNNTQNYTGLHNILLGAGETDSAEHGNEITLAGTTNRLVVEFEVKLGIFCCGPAQFDAQLRLYRNDGPDGQPGSAIWASEVRTLIIDSGNPEAIPISYLFEVPRVLVPSTFTWTIQITNREGNLAPMGPSEYSPPETGSAPFGFWHRTGPAEVNWEYSGKEEPPFGAKVTAACLGDLDGCGTVGVHDLAILLGAWGPNAGHVADIDGNGVVDATDLALLLGAWGPCQ